MNKKVSVVLFPVLAAMVLTGCTLNRKSTKKKTSSSNDSSQTTGGDTTGGTTGGDTSGGTTGGTTGGDTGGGTTGGDTGGGTSGDTSTFATTAGSEVDASSFTLDFKNDSSIKDSKMFPFVEAGGKYTFEFSKVAVGFKFSDAGTFANSGYLMMQNQKSQTSWGQLAFLSNNTPFKKAITKVEIVTNDNQSASGNMELSVVIGNTYFTEGQTGGSTGKGRGQTITATASKSENNHFFCITSTNQKYNAQILSLSVTLE